MSTKPTTLYYAKADRTEPYIMVYRSESVFLDELIKSRHGTFGVIELSPRDHSKVQKHFKLASTAPSVKVEWDSYKEQWGG